MGRDTIANVTDAHSTENLIKRLAGTAMEISIRMRMVHQLKGSTNIFIGL